jgi:hypothetical protein
VDQNGDRDLSVVPVSPFFRLKDLLSEPMVDLNLLIRVFPVVLADALDPTLTTVEVLLQTKMSRECRAAEAS